MKIDRPQHPAGWERGASRGTPPDGDNEYAAFAAQLAARAEKLRATPISTSYAAPSFDPEEATSQYLLSSLRAAARNRAVWASGALLAVIAIVAVWLLSYPSPQPLSAKSIEPAKAAAPSSTPPPPRVEARTLPPAPATSAPPAAPPAAAAPADRQEAAKPAPDVPATSAQIPTTAQATAAPLTKDEVRELQERLKAAGFNPGRIDGALGPRTRGALRKYAESRDMPNPDPTKDMLLHLRAEPVASR